MRSGNFIECSHDLNLLDYRDFTNYVTDHVLSRKRLSSTKSIIIRFISSIIKFCIGYVRDKKISIDQNLSIFLLHQFSAWFRVNKSRPGTCSIERPGVKGVDNLPLLLPWVVYLNKNRNSYHGRRIIHDVVTIETTTVTTTTVTTTSVTTTTTTVDVETWFIEMR